MERKLPEGWEWRTLHELSSNIINGGTPSTKNEGYWDGDIPWVTSSSIKGPIINNGEKFISIDALANSSTNVIPKNNLLFVTRIGIGKAAVNTIDVAFSQDITGVQLKNDIVNPHFLARYILSPKVSSKLVSWSRGSTIKGLQRSQIEQLRIPVPPLETQRKIVAILDKAEETKRLRAQSNELTQKLLQSVFLEMFGDPLVNSKGWDCDNIHTLAIKGYITVQNGFACGDHNEIGNGIPQLRPMNIGEFGNINMDKILFIKPMSKKISKYLLIYNDIIFNNTNSRRLVGKNAVWNEFMEEKKYVLSNHMTILRLSKVSPILPHYFSQFLNYLWREGIFQNMCTPHVNQASVSFDRLGSISVPLPEIDLQNKFQKIVTHIIKNGAIQKNCDDKNRYLLESIVEKLFKGELTA